MTTDFNLRQFYSQNNRLTLPFGVNYGSTIRLGVHNIRLTLLLIYFCADVGSNVLLAFPGLLKGRARIYAGDVALIVFSKEGGIIFFAQMLYRVSAAFMLMNFCMDNTHSWLRDASDIFDTLKNQRLVDELKIVAKRSQKIALANAILRCAVISIALTMALPPITEQYPVYVWLPGVIVMELFTIMTPSIDGQFLVDLFMICQVAASTFSDLNRALKDPTKKMDLQQYLNKFDNICMFVNTIMRYVGRLFILFYTINIVVITFIFYKIFFTENELMVAILMAIFGITELIMILFVSQFVGKIDRTAKYSAEIIFMEYILKDVHGLDKRQQLMQWDLRKYFFICWCTPISLTFLGQPINPETSIKIITIILTALAVILNQ